MPKSTLQQHIQDCELRYQRIDSRLESLERKVDAISNQIDGFKTFFLKLSAKLALGAITSLFAAVYVIKFH